MSVRLSRRLIVIDEVEMERCNYRNASSRSLYCTGVKTVFEAA